MTETSPDEAASPAFDVERVLRRMLAVARDQFWRLAVIAVLVFGVPSGLYGYWLDRTEPGDWTREAASVAMLLLAVLGQSTVSLISLNRSQALPVTLGSVLAEAWAAFPAMLAIAVLQFLGVGVGLFLLIVPGLYLAAAWSVAGPIHLVHNEGIIRSLRLSLAMTEGVRRRILLVMLSVFLPPFLLFYLAGKIIDLVPAAEMVRTLVLEPLDGIVLPVLNGLLSASIFHELKWGGGSVRPDETAEVFA